MGRPSHPLVLLCHQPAFSPAPSGSAPIVQHHWERVRESVKGVGEGVRAYSILKLTFLMIDFALVLWPLTKGEGWNLKLFDRNWKRSCD